MANRTTGGISGSGGSNVNPVYKPFKPTILEPELRPGGTLNPTKPKDDLDPKFGVDINSLKKSKPKNPIKSTFYK